MLPAGARMRRSADFTATLRASRAARVRGMLVVHAANVDPGVEGGPLVGFVVPRSVGSAVARNRVRRRLRHLLRSRLGRLPAGTRIVVRVLPPAASASSAQLGETLDSGLARLVPPTGAGS